MRFHKIRIENLNSLYGAHEVDLEHALSGAGLFLIHGPTGAGKSTVLDAICLALYGKTPRMDGKSVINAVKLEGDSGPTDPALSMSRGTGTSLAEVELSICGPDGNNQRYRAGWSVRRARDKADGKLQAPVRRLQILTGGAWKLLCESHKIKEFEDPFKEALQGLSFEDFQRTTMLAQFAFRQFLEADEKTRGVLLERMTSGADFRLIGQRAAEARKAAGERLATLTSQLGGKVVWSPEEEDAKRAELAATAAEGKRLVERLASLEAARRFWLELVKCSGRLDKAREDGALLAAERQARTHELAALEQDEALAPARQALAQWRSHVAAAGAREAASHEAQRVYADAAAARERAAAARAVTGGERQRAEAELASAEPVLVAATIAWQALAQARTDEASARAELVKRERSFDEVSERAQAVTTAEATVRRELGQAQGALGEIPDHERLASEVPGLVRDLEEVTKERREVVDKRSELLVKTVESEQLGRRSAELELRSAELTAPLEGARETTRQAQAALSAATQGEAPEAVQRALGEAIARVGDELARLGEVDGLLEVLDGLAAELAASREAGRQAEEHAELERSRAAALEAEIAAEDERLAGLEREVALRDKVLNLVEEREVLQSGQACPLCGSADHPYADAPASAPDSAHYRLEQDAARQRSGALKASIKAARKALGEANKALIEQLTIARGKAERADAVALQIEARKLRVHALAAALGLGVALDREARLALRARLDGDKRHATAQNDALVGLVASARAAVAAQQALEQTVSKSADERVALAADRRVIEAHLTTLRGDVAARVARVAARESGLAEALKGLQIAEPTLESGVAKARERADQVRELTSALKRLDGRLQKALAELAAAQEARGAAERERSRAREAAAQAELRLREAQAVTLGYFGGQNPAPTRAALTKAVSEAVSADDLAARGLSRRESELAGAQARLGDCERELHEARQVAQASEEAFGLRCAERGVAGADDVELRSLTDGQRWEWRALRDRLGTGETEVGARLRDAEQALVTHEATRPEGEAAGDAGARVEALEVEKQEVEAERSAIEQRLGALRGELERNASERTAKAAIEVQRKAAEFDAEQWGLVAGLIGTNNGEAFVLVVQALNLRSVIERANRRLEHFMPRYELVQAFGDDKAPRLDFHVVDGWSQGAHRTVRSLSGGESFIVSLALALGLADLRSAKLRIETLLIDEGFGSLDSETLQHVLAALSVLQQASGAQIGLISHVDAMREAVPAQIEVVPLGEGRSLLKVRS